MKKSIYIGGISVILISITGIGSSFAANTMTSRNRSLPPELSTLSETEIATLKTLTGSAREEYLTSKGITPPVAGSGSLERRHGSGETDKDPIDSIISLTDDEKTALETMTETERDAFFASKGIIPPTNTGSGVQVKQNKEATQNKNTQLNTSKKTSTIKDISKQARAERLAIQKAKVLAQKITKIQKKILANEKLTRLEKKFADENNIEY